MYINDYTNIVRNSSSFEVELLHSNRKPTQDLSISTSIISDLNERSSSSAETTKSCLNSLLKFMKIIFPFNKQNCCPKLIKRSKSLSSSRPNSLKKIINNDDDCLTSSDNLSVKKYNNKMSFMSMSTSYSSKELTWYKMEELKHYYDVLEHVMEETSANIFNVIEVLQEKLIILTGGCAKDGSPLLTFTDNCIEREIKEENYRKTIDYLCNIPSGIDKKEKEEEEVGYSLIIDRRNDKWSSVKHVLLLIQNYFPVKLNTIYILRPQSYLQRVLSHLFFQEDTLNTLIKKQLNLKICKTLEELYEYIDKKQLTSEFGGNIHYRHQEWIEQRQFIEKLSSTVNEAVSNIKLFIKSMEDTDFPNDVNTTQSLIDTQLKQRNEILTNVLSTRKFGETVLNVIEKTNKIDTLKSKNEKYSALTPDIRIHYQTVFNLINYLDDSEQTLNEFWKNHHIRLNKCLDLRKFEFSFKNVRFVLLRLNEKLTKLNDENFTKIEEYDYCIDELMNLIEQSETILNEATKIHEQGSKLLNDNDDVILNNNNNNDNTSKEQVIKETLNIVKGGGYCIDSLEPKCNELKRYIDDYYEQIEVKMNTLQENKILLIKLKSLKDHYNKGMNLFNEQKLININQEHAKKYLNDNQMWLKSYEDLIKPPSCEESFYENNDIIFMSSQINEKMSHKTQMLNQNIQEIYNQLNSLNLMFNKRQEQLKKLANPIIYKPVQRVEPLNSHDNQHTKSYESLHRSHLFSISKKNRRNSTQAILKLSAQSVDNLDEEQIKLNEKKLKMVINELVETEKVYINELKLIVEGYVRKIEDSSNHRLISNGILTNKDILFGNIQEIFEFHFNLFYPDLDKVKDCVEDVCNLFIKHKEHFYSYATYCSNKPHSEEVWQEHGLNCTFLKMIQQNLGHRLPLDTYLLKPVQRISKYQLLLKEMLKYNTHFNEKQCIEHAMVSMLDVVNNLNDAMHASFIVGCDLIKLQGRLLKRDQLQMTKYKRNSKSSMVNKLKLAESSNKAVELFLYEKALIICKRKSDDSTFGSSTLSPYSSSSTISSHSFTNFVNGLNYSLYYQFKDLLKTNEIGLTENIKSDKKKFEIWSDVYAYRFEASNEHEKNLWTIQIKLILENQLNEIKLKQQLLNSQLNQISFERKLSHPQKNIKNESDEDGSEIKSHMNSSSSNNSLSLTPIDSTDDKIISF